MQHVHTLKLTEGETQLLDWLVKHAHASCRGEMLRRCLISEAFRHEAPERLQRKAHRERQNTPISTKLRTPVVTNGRALKKRPAKVKAQ